MKYKCECWVITTEQISTLKNYWNLVGPVTNKANDDYMKQAYMSRRELQ